MGKGQAGYPSMDGYNTFASFLLTLAENAKSLKEKGIEEPSHLFLAPESAGIYERMMSTRDSSCIIRIYSPWISDEKTARQICASFGIDMEKKDTIEPAEQHAAVRGSLLSDSAGLMFRKTKFLLRHPNGATYRTGDCASYSNLESFDSELGFIRDFPHIPVPMNIKKPEDVGFYFRKYDHPGGERDVSEVGWLVESLLQQLGVPYAADNGVANLKYFYNPTEKRIEKL